MKVEWTIDSEDREKAIYIAHRFFGQGRGILIYGTSYDFLGYLDNDNVLFFNKDINQELVLQIRIAIKPKGKLKIGDNVLLTKEDGEEFEVNVGKILVLNETETTFELDHEASVSWEDIGAKENKNSKYYLRFKDLYNEDGEGIRVKDLSDYPFKIGIVDKKIDNGNI